jgi:uncharacterized protein involved in exopolysaccharide biosynthesis
MITNRELGFDDYLAICRRRAYFVVFPALVATILGFAISYLFTAKYTSVSLLLVEGQVVPTGYVKPIVTERVSDRMLSLEQNVFSRNRLQPLVVRLGLATKGKTVDQVVEEIRDNVTVTAADPNAPSSGATSSTTTSKPPTTLSIRKKLLPDATDDVPGFNVSFTANNPRDAQQVCAEITSMLLQENLDLREQVAQSTTDFLVTQLTQAKNSLDELDDKLSKFKKTYLGRLPSDAEKNLSLLSGLNTQLDSNTQVMNRAQQDKSFAESLLAEQTASWKASQASPNLPTLRQQLINLQNQLLLQQTMYTDDHPDIVRLKKDITELQAKLKDDVSSAVSGSQSLNKEDAAAASIKTDPPEIVQLREQIHQDNTILSRAAAEQRRLQGLIQSYQDKLAVSPDVEDEYRKLTRDNDTARTIYNNLLTDKSAAEMQTEMERKQQGEQIKLLDPASLPSSPSFPVRWMFAAGGLGAGLALGIGAALWLELRDKAIRNEGDVEAALELPMLVSVPWVGAEGNAAKQSRSLKLFPEKRVV